MNIAGVLVLDLLFGLVLGGCKASSSSTNASSSTKPEQLVTAIVDDWTATHATLRLWTKDATGWQAVGTAWPAVIGDTGSAWAAEPPPGRTGPKKREGDGKSPAGRFHLGHVYGYAADAPPGTKLPYTSVDTSWKCVDDPESKQYARVVDRAKVANDWKSAEDMQRGDSLYRWVVDTEFNAAQVPEAGSCIFLHVWHGAESSTVGCTAMAEPALVHLISMLEPDASYVLLPRAEYEALREPWGLPAQ